MPLASNSIAEHKAEPKTSYLNAELKGSGRAQGYDPET
jgi:hypothetical protein